MDAEWYVEALDRLLKALCVRFEGVRLRPYLCPAGVATIGVGATMYEDGRKVSLADPPISHDRAMALLDHDARTYLNIALRLSPILHGKPAQAAAVADFVYNLGAARYRASTLKKRVDGGIWAAAQAEVRKWVFGGGRKLPGLVTRRGAEAELLGRPIAAAAVPKSAANANAPISRGELIALIERAQGEADPLAALLAGLRAAA